MVGEVLIAAAGLLTLGSRNVSAQSRSPTANETVFILADSLEWVLTFHTFPGSGTVACDVATRAQPGAIYRTFWEGQRTFTVHLMQSEAPVDSFVLQVDDRRPVVRKPTREEREANVLHLRGRQGDVLVGPGISTFRVQAFYPNRGKQDLTVDMGGFSALYPRALRFDCLPPGFIWR